MGKVQGYFIGYRQFAVDRNWLREQEEARYQERQRKFEQWSKKWITVTRLKTDRLWTDWAIKKWLGKPQKRGVYNVFPVAEVKAAESKKEFKDWHSPRLEKKLSTHQFFSIPDL
ncbi:hypothetical protein WAB73_003276 [Salmonella enterica subsp. enterica]